MMGNGNFQGAELVGEDLLAWITEARVTRAEDIRRHAQQRRRRPALAPDGKLVILAADHPARGVTRAHDDPLALANRQEYLGRILRVLQSGYVDGLMGTADVVEEVLAADLIGGAGLLEDKLLIGCMNRGGLAGTTFEMWDAVTAYDVQGLRKMNLDGAKLMFRLDPQSRDSGETMRWCAEAINACLDADLAVFLEPLPVLPQDGRLVVEAEAGALARICGIASALGRSSLRTWLKLPYCADYETVARATTCPILMLGGEAGDDPVALLEGLSRGMRAGSNVRGALIGRNVLFPKTHDPGVMAAAICRVVHEGLSAEEAWQEAGG